MHAKLKAEHKDKVVVFGGGGNVPLGEREDLDQLAIIGLESGDKSILDLFEHPLPKLSTLKKAHTDEQLKQAPSAEGSEIPATEPGPLNSEIIPPAQTGKGEKGK